MREFKDGSLKSGGSGRKVTNPKQAMAIALSEANRMNQGGIVGLAQMQSPFANSIRPQAQTMGPRPLESIIGDQRIPPVASPMQRNFSQIQGQGQQPLDAYKGYLQSTYILPMQQNEVQKVNQFVDAVGQAERQFFGGQQGGKTFGGRLQPGMPGSGLVEQGRGQPMGPLQPRELTLTNSVLRPNQAPDVMPPMNQAPAVMPEGLLEPLRMNQGGMMYSDIMNRPMFQTPQQRQGMGIMAGVAPVRGYANGGEAESELGFMDYARVMPGVIKDMVVGDDGTMSDFFTTEKTAEGQGLTARDLFDFFIVDPEDPTDVAIATTTAGLMASGVGAPGAIAAQLGRMGYKGKKVADVVEKAVRLGVGDTRAKTFGRGQTARMAPALVGSEEAMAQEAAPAAGGIASLPAEEVQVSEKNPVTVEEIESLGISAEDFAKLKPEVQQEYLQLLNDRRMAANVGYSIGSGIAGMGDILTAPVRGVGEGLEAIAQSRLGRAIGLSEPGEVDEPFELFPMSEYMQEGARRNAPATMEQLKQGFEPPAPPSAPAVSEVEEDPFASVTPQSQAFVEQQVEEVEPESSGGIFSMLQDPATQYALAKAAQPTEGRVPRNFLSDMVLAKEEYRELERQRDLDERRMQQEERGTAFEQQLEILKKERPDLDAAGRINLLLSKDASELEELTLFSNVKAQYYESISDSLKGQDLSADQIDAIADRLARRDLNMEPREAASGGASINVDAEGNEIAQ